MYTFETGNYFELYPGFIGVSKAVSELSAIVDKIADKPCIVLITGESGVGKELVARAIHKRSSRESDPFVAADCTTLTPTLAESELFGHKRGSYTGAFEDVQGVFGAAEGGTIFLDEISELPFELQPKLLRVLELGTFRRVGEPTERRSHARVIAATNKNLSELVREGSFRKDLFYRLNVFPIQVPPLRERREDIQLLATHFLKVVIRHFERRFSHEAIQFLESYDWPGNVRELRNVVERASIMSDEQVITDHDLKAVMVTYCCEESHGYRENMSMEELEAWHIKNVLEYCGWVQIKAAKILGLNRLTVQRKMEKYGIKKPDPS